MTVTSTTEISTAWAYRDKVTSTQSNCYSKPFLCTQYVLKPRSRERKHRLWKERKTKDLMKKYDRQRERESEKEKERARERERERERSGVRKQNERASARLLGIKEEKEPQGPE